MPPFRLRSTPLAGAVPGALPVATIAGILGVAALLCRVGSDAGWLTALGHVIAVRHHVPAGVPFATAPTSHWPNPLVLPELIFAGLHGGLGDRGLMLAQLLAVAAGLAILAGDARRGGADQIGTAGALALVGVGALASLAIVRVQLFSLVLFPALVALLRAEARAPSRRIWLVVPLLALWSNLHGVALLGLGVVIAHLIFERGPRQPRLAALVGVCSAAALWLTPALARTGDYYLGLLTNAAAQRGQGMWGPFSPGNPLDLLLGLAAIVLVAKLVSARAARWEWVVVAALAVLSIRAERDGVWLLLFLAPPAARALHPARSLRALALPAGALGAAGLLLVVMAIARGPAPAPGSALVPGAVAAAHGTPVLADGSLDEAVAVAGGRIWAGNPIDAFSRRVQDAYLSWLAGAASAAPVPAGVEVVLVTRGTPEQRLMAGLTGFTVARGSAAALLYERSGRAAR